MPASATQRKRSANGAYDAELDDEQLLDVVAELAREVRPDNPASVSQRAWDRALVASRYAGKAPQARGVVMRLSADNAVSVSWRQVIEASLKPARNRQQTLGVWQRTEPAAHITVLHVYYAVRRVARELGGPPTTPGGYRRGREGVIRAARRRGIDPALLERKLPTATQLTNWAGGDRPSGPTYWGEVLSGAAYEPELAADDGSTSSSPSAKAEGLPVAEGIAHFVRLNGYWPSNTILRQWARESGIALSRLNDPWTRRHESAEEILVAEGVDTATVARAPTGRGHRASWVFAAAGIPGAPRRTKTGPARGPRERLIVALREFDDLLPRRERRTLGRYRQLLPNHPDWPAASNIIKRGGWSNLLAEAQALNRANAPAVEIVANESEDGRDPDRVYEDLGDGFIRSSARADKKLSPKGKRRRARRAAANRRYRCAKKPVSDGQRGRGRQSAVSLADLVRAGILRDGERLIGANREARWDATFDAESGAVTVAGEGTFVSLTAAAMHCRDGHTANGWDFFGVERDGRLVRLSKLRRRNKPAVGDGKA